MWTNNNFLINWEVKLINSWITFYPFNIRHWIEYFWYYTFCFWDQQWEFQTKTSEVYWPQSIEPSSFCFWYKHSFKLSLVLLSPPTNQTGLGFEQCCNFTNYCLVLYHKQAEYHYEFKRKCPGLIHILFKSSRYNRFYRLLMQVKFDVYLSTVIFWRKVDFLISKKC